MSRAPLEERVADPGFTPGKRDILPLLSLVIGEDEALAKRAEAVLSKTGEATAEAVVTFAEAAPRAEAHRLARLLGALGGERSRTYLVRQLTEARGKERRWAATSLAKVWPKGAEKPLLEALRGASAPEDVRAFVQALGKVGGAPTLAVLGRLPTTDPETQRVVEKAKLLLSRTATRHEDRAPGAAPAVDLETPREARGRVSVRFTCREGLESVLAEELGACGPRTQVMATGRGFVTVVHSGSLAALLDARTALSLAFEVDAYLPEAKGPLAARVAELLTSRAVLDIVAASGAPARFRLVLRSEGHGRATVFEVARLVAQSGTPLVNDPTESAWTFTVEERGDRLAVFLEPKNVQKTRFAYRVRDVPAASHPTIAAAIARLSAPSPDDVVWDPFCGSGLELIERAKLGRFRALVGTDVDPDAVEAARTNMQAARIEGARLDQGDSRFVSWPAELTTVLTNPPLGRRVLPGEHEELLADVLKRIGRALGPGGRLVWVSPTRRLDAVAEEAGLELKRAFDVDLGGFEGRLEVRVKKGVERAKPAPRANARQARGRERRR